MNLTEKGLNALNQARTHFPHGYFSAADLSAKCGEKIVAATLNGVVTKGYMEKMAGTPVKYCLIDNIEELIANDEPTKKGGDNTNLARAKKVKNDEFYTQFSDVNNEVTKYKKYFKGKAVFCNCNDGLNSQFMQFFLKNFDAFQLTRLVGIAYAPNGKGIKYDLYDDINHDGFITEEDFVVTELEGDGGFGTEESIAELEKCDIVCTNPPFSVFRDYVELLMKHNKKFLIVAPQGCTSYKQTFKRIVDGEMWLGYNKVKHFLQPDGTIKDFGNICWVTNMPTRGEDEMLILTATYYEDADRREPYDTYDNYEAINVDKIKNIPKDYDGVMGVPITILEQFNPLQFEIVGCNAYSDPDYYGVGALYVNGTKKYTRILIKKR